MKKIGIILIIMLVIVFLSTRTGKIEKKSLSGVSKEQAVLEKNKDKYNKHIRFYNRILNIDKGLLYYFEDAGMDKQFKNIQTEVSENLVSDEEREEKENYLKLLESEANSLETSKSNCLQFIKNELLQKLREFCYFEEDLFPDFETRIKYLSGKYKSAANKSA